MLVKIGQIDGFNTIVNSLISSFVVGSYLPLTGGTLTGNLTAPTFIGALSGNATTATRLQTARTIALSGAATGTATSFNGSANISISVTGLNASNLNAGTVPTARLGSGTASSSTVLYGNNTWGTIPAAVDTITRLRGTTSGTLVSGDITLLAGSNTTITQSGNSITIASTNTNTTYTAGTGITLSGTTFSHTAHTGDVTGATALTIANNAVTFAKMQNISTQRLLGRGTAGAGNIEELTLGANLTLSTTGVLSATNTNTTYTGSNGINVTGTVISPTYGTAANTIAQGNDSRINNGQTAFGWGNHSGLYALVGRSITAGNGLSGGGTLAANRTITLGTPTAIGISTTNAVTTSSHTHALDTATITAINNGQTAFGWGNHALAGYLTSTALNNYYQSGDVNIPALGGDYVVFPTNATTAIFDFDTITEAGFYKDMSTPGVVNAPKEGHWYVENLTYGSSNLIQYAHPYRVTDGKWMRNRLQGVWTPWVEFIHTDNLDTNVSNLGFIKSSNLSGYVPTSRTLTAGNGLSGGGNLTANRTFALGTPSAITLSSTNSVTTSSHTHAFTPGGTTAQYIRGDGSLATMPTIPTVGNGSLTIGTPTGLSSSGTFTANQSGNSTISLAYATGYQGYTTVEATKLAGLSNYVLPTASATVLGGIKVGSNLSINASGVLSATNTNTTYTAGAGLTLSGTAFSLPVTVSGTGTYVQSVTQTTDGITVTLGTPPNTNTQYTNMSIAELNTGTVTTGRSISASVLNQWLNAKGFSTQTLTAGSNITISGSTISATNTNTTYSAGTGLSLTGTTFANTAPNATHTGDVTGATALTIANSAVTHAKYQNIATQRILGRGATGTGNVQELTLGSGLALSTTGVLSATGSGGTVSSVGMTVAGTALTVSGSPITTSGTLALTWSGATTQYVRGDGSLATIPTNHVTTSRSITAGNGLSGGGTLAANRTITMGTPDAITLSSTNSVATSSHTHAFTPGGTTAQYIRGDGSLATFPSIPSISNLVTTNTQQTVNSKKQWTTPQTNVPITNYREISNIGAWVGSSSNAVTTYYMFNFGDALPAVMWEAELVLIQYSSSAAINISQSRSLKIKVSGYNSSAGGAITNKSVDVIEGDSSIIDNVTYFRDSNNLLSIGIKLNVAAPYPKAFFKSIKLHHSVNDSRENAIVNNASVTALTDISSLTSVFVVGAANMLKNIDSGNINSITTLVQTSRTITAGNGLSGGGNLTANRTITLGTPTAITLSSTNSVATSSHTHAFTPGGTTAQYIRGDGSLATYVDTTYTAGTGLSLSGTTFGQAITTSGTGTYVQSITQTASGFQVNLGTPPNSNTTYSNMTIAELNTGTVTTGRSISASVLNQWLNAKGFSTQTLTAGSNITISGSTISATNTNTTYSAGTGLSLSGTTFGQAITTSGTGTYVQSITQTASGFQVNLGTPPNTNTNTTYSAGTGLSLSGTTFNVNYGTSAGTSAQGNDSRINNGQTAFGWGNHSGKYHIRGGSTAQLSVDAIKYASSFRFNASSENPTNEIYSGITYGNDSNVVGQILTHYITGETYVRAYNSAWSPFRKLITDGNLDSEATALGFIKSASLSGYVPTSRTITAGNGLSGGGSLAANRTITMGTPGAITLSSTNSVATSSHTHAFTPGGTTAQYIRGDGSLASFPSIPSNYTLPTATATVLGGVKLFSNTVQTVAATAVSATASRTYGIQTNSSGQLVVNVPWTNTNTNTTYTAGTGLTLTGTVFSLPVNITGTSSGNYVADVAASATGLTVTKGILPVSSLVTATTAAGVSNVATTNTNTFLNIVEGNASVGSSTQITGTGSVTVTSDAAGKLTINGTNTNTTYSGSTSIILSGTSFQRAALTGDVTASQNSNATTIANNVVTFTKMQNIATQKLLGRSTTGTGNIEEITLGTGLTLTGGVLSAAGGGSVSQATATVLGGVKLFSNTVQTVAATAVSATSGKTYGIQLNSSGQAVVNVPWSNTTYTSGTVTLLNAGTNSTNRVWGASILNDWLNGKGYLKSIQVNGTMVYTNGAGGNMRLFTNNNSGVFYADGVSGGTDIHFHMEDSRRYNFGDGPKNVDYIYEAHIGTPFSVPLMNGEKIFVAVYWHSNNMWHDPHSVPNEYLMDTYGVLTDEHIDKAVVPIRGNIVLPSPPPHPYLCVFYYFGNGYCEIEFIGFVKLDDICAQKLNGLEYGVIILATFRREYGSLFVDPKIF